MLFISELLWQLVLQRCCSAIWVTTLSIVNMNYRGTIASPSQTKRETCLIWLKLIILTVTSSVEQKTGLAKTTRTGKYVSDFLIMTSEHCNECTTIPGISDHEAVRVRSEHCNECTTIPGISDHEAVRVTSEHCNECTTIPGISDHEAVRVTSEHCNECTTIPGISDHEAVRVTSEHCNECTTIPGISDHEAVRVTSTFGTKRWFTLDIVKRRSMPP